ncbi:MAG: hypothetical protein CVT90_01855, partial [Candidatus Altiarchaeales archaeon HGW-Altiarchaeales-3]
ITDTLPPEVTFNSSSPSPWSISGNTITWNLTWLNIDGSAAYNHTPTDPWNYTINVRVKVNSSTPAGTINNFVNITCAEDVTANTDESTGIVINANLNVSKDGPINATPGTQFNYTLTIFNNGPSDAENVTITDVLPAGISFNNSAASCVGTANGFTCNLGNMTAGQNISVIVTVNINSDIKNTIINSVTVTSNTPDNDSSDDEATENTPVIPDANLNISKTGPDNATPGTQFNYTVTVFNNGPSDANSVIVTDTLPTGVTFLSASPGICVATANGFNCDMGDMIVGENKTVIILVKIDSNITEFITNSVTVTSATGDSNETDNNDTVDTPVTPDADLNISKSGPVNATPGTEFNYNLVITNNGPSVAKNVSVIDTLPTGVSFVSASGAICSGTANGFTCDLGNMTVGQSITVTVVVKMDSNVTESSVLNSVTVTSDTNDTIDTNNNATENTSLNPIADLKLTKTVNNSVPNIGETVKFTITVTNEGPSDATGVKVLDTLPSGLINPSYAPSQGTYNTSTNIWDIKNISAGASVILEITAVVNQTVDITNTAEINDSDQLDDDSTPGNNVSSEDDQDNSTTSGQMIDLELTKTVSDQTPNVMGWIVYTIIVTNDGPSDATGVLVKDNLPGGLINAQYYPPEGTTYNSFTGIWNIGNIAAGATATFKIMAMVNQTDNITNIAEVIAADQPDSDSTPNNNDSSEDDQDNVTLTGQQADLVINKSADEFAAPGSYLIYTIIITNTGPNDAINVNVTDILPDNVTFNSATASPISINESVNYTTVINQTYWWFFNEILAGNSTTITVNVTVNNNATGILNNFVNVISYTYDNNADNDNDTANTTVSFPSIVINKTANASYVLSGTSVKYTYNVTNAGNCPITNINVTDDKCSPVSCPKTELAVGENMICNCTTTIDVDTTNIANVTGDAPEDTPVFDNDSAFVDVIAPNITINKTVNKKIILLGEFVNYTYVVKNTGDVNLTNINLNDNESLNINMTNCVEN